MQRHTPPTKSIADLPDIRERIICPICQHHTTYSTTSVRCMNVECETEFPVTGGIPILINESESLFTIEKFLTHQQKKYQAITTKNSATTKVKQFAKRMRGMLQPSLSLNLSYKRNFNMLNRLLSHQKNPKILIIGGAIITSGTEMLFAPERTIVESDIYIGPRTQVIIDAHHIPFEDETFDLVIFQAVLEHVLDPPQCVAEAHRVLKNDGIIFATTPFMQQVHMKAYDFTRYTQLGHRRLFRAFEQMDSGVIAGTGVALGWSIRYFLNSLTTNKYARSSLLLIASWLFFWLKYIDYITYKNKATINGASGFYFIGKKSICILDDKELIKMYRGI
ncbi:MAG: class I SAM-dependent methyltransferase [Candidatus Electrothrix aestuarii]|uniref:Class I SAM-dependent methyltransferase n=1 Tax=Candidatus Electrothrix aestuarii TaxID=3062594 RepID=A0AAU8LZ87_9BACT|nr:class I SAM-dependent methyltransferase [Candidatus Electrothrix aestuarii]